MSILKRLHWLPVASRIQYKICMLTYKCLHAKAPAYLSEMLTPYQPTRALRSGSQCMLREKPGRLKTVGDRSFRAAAPKLWNRLPLHLRMSDTLDAFKQGLKTHLFRIAYEDQCVCDTDVVLCRRTVVAVNVANHLLSTLFTTVFICTMFLISITDNFIHI